MSQIDLTTASELFDTEVTLQYQNEQKLRGVVAERHGTTGDATNVPVSDLIEMSQASFAPANIPVTSVENTNVVVTPFNYTLKTAIGGGEKTLFAYNKIVDHARDHAKAAGRMLDYLKINGLFADANYNDVTVIPVDVGPTTGMNADKMAAALSELENQGVDVTDNMLSMWLPAIVKQSLLNDDKVVNEFYNNRQPLTDYRLPNYMGVDIHTLGAKGINTIPFTTNGGTDTYEVPIVHRDAMVQIFNRDVETRIVFVEQEDRYELLTVLTTGVKVVQTSGIVAIAAENPFAAN